MIRSFAFPISHRLASVVANSPQRHSSSAHTARLLHWLYHSLSGFRRPKHALCIEYTLLDHEAQSWLFRSAVSQSHDAIYTKTLAGIVTSWNPSAERLYGWRADEIIGKNVEIIIPDNRRQELADILARLRQNQQISHVDTIRQHKNGHYIPVSVTISPVSTPDGRIVGASVIARDISQRISAEEQFRVAVEASPSGMVLVDQEGVILLANAETEHLFGYRRDELLGQHVEILVPEGFRSNHRRFREGFVAQPKARMMGVSRDLLGRRKDGSTFQIEIGLTPVQTNEDLRILCSIVDITERRQQEERLLAQASIIQNLFDAMIGTDQAFIITSWNRAAERLYGWTAEEAIGHNVGELLRTHYPLNNAEEIVQQFRKQGGWTGELVQFHRDGTPINILTSVAETHDIHGQAIGVVAINRDITELKHAEQQLSLQADELRRSNSDLEQFAYIASHDLQEPLRMVASYTELLGQRYKGKLDERADKYIFYAVDGARRMQQLVNDLLSYARIGSQAKPFVSIDSHRLAEQVVSLFQPMIDERGAHIVLQPLPTVYADATQLRQVFQNLLSNALKFASERSPEITIAAVEQEHMWVFSVTDNGIGIQAEYAERVFQIFQRLHERGKYEGSGIGLAVVRRIIDRHGGKVWFESAYGEGTTFFFSIPVSGETSHGKRLSHIVGGG